MNEDMDFLITVRLKKNKKVFFGPGPARLLELIGSGFSLQKASKNMNMAYSKAWKIINEAEEIVGYPLTKRIAGGIGGGNTVLTDEGKAFLEKYLLFEKNIKDIAQKKIKEIFSD